MADNDFVQPPAEIPLTLPLHDPSEQNAPAPAPGIFEKIKQSAHRTFEKHGVIFKPGRGRPRADGSPKISDVPLNVPASAVPASAAPGPASDSPAFDSGLVRRCISAVSKGIFGFLDKRLWQKAVKIGKDPTYASDLIKSAAITTEELNSFSELAEICLRKYGVGTQYAPEIGLGAIAIGVGLRYATAFGQLNAEEAMQKKAREKIPAPAVPELKKAA